MKKEQVTTYQIHKDLMQCIYNEIMAIIIGFPLLWILFALCSALIQLYIFANIPLLEIGTLLFVLCAMLCFIYILIVYIKIKRLKYSFRIVTLVKKQDCRPQIGKWISYKPHRLFFDNGDFYIPVELHYRWSHINSMDAKDIYNTSSIGDTFTTVELNKQIWVVYNNNIFDVPLDIS